MIAVGKPIPAFALAGLEADGITERQFDSAELGGRAAVLAFYPADNSPVCRMQLTEYSNQLPELTNLDATVWAISPQSVEEHRNWVSRRGEVFGFPLLADGDKSVGRAFGILGLLDLYRRSTFVVDANGIVRWTHRSLGGALTYPSSEQIAEQLGAC
jgi:peroxiredoxin Q/BCP